MRRVVHLSVLVLLLSCSDEGGAGDPPESSQGDADAVVGEDAGDADVPAQEDAGPDADELQEDFWNFAMEPSPPEDPAIRNEVANALVRLDLLRELGQDAAAEFELERLKRHFMQRDGALYALAEAFNERGFTFTGINLGWEIHRREGAWNPRLLRIIYPFPYRDLIVAEARERCASTAPSAGNI